MVAANILGKAHRYAISKNLVARDVAGKHVVCCRVDEDVAGAALLSAQHCNIDRTTTGMDKVLII